MSYNHPHIRYQKTLEKIFGSDIPKPMIKLTDIAPDTILLIWNYVYNEHDPEMVPALPVLESTDGVYRGCVEVKDVRQSWTCGYHYVANIRVKPFDSDYFESFRVARGSDNLHDGDWFITGSTDKRDCGTYVYIPTIEQWEKYCEYNAKLDADREAKFSKQQAASAEMISQLNTLLKQPQSL